MKVAHSILVLLCVTISLGFPIQLLLTDGTPTIRAGNSVVAQSQRAITAEKPVNPRRPSFQQYIDRLREVPTIPIGDESNPTETKTIPSPVAITGSYGTFLGKFISNDGHPKDALAKSPANQRKTSDSTKQTIVTCVKPADLLDILDKHGPECIALGLFVLVPIAYFVLELLELAVKSCAREQFPRRGRVRVRLVGPERRLHAWGNRQRELVVESEKRWWQTSRGRC